MRALPIFAYLLIFAGFMSFAQKKETGISFVHGKYWNEILQQAKKEKKYIFVDCYTTWCGPCKMMASDVFPEKEVGDFFNKNFISFKAQIDKTEDDPADIKKLYADFEKIDSTYKIQAYPTFLFFTPEGKLVHRLVGGAEPAEFIAKAKEALNPETQYYTLASKFTSNKKDTAYLRKMINLASDCYEDATPYFNAYVSTQSDMFSDENLIYIQKLSGSIDQPGFKLIYEHPEKINAKYGDGVAENYIYSVIAGEYSRKLFSDFEDEPDPEIASDLQNKYPQYANRIISYAKISKYQTQENWTAFENEVVNYMKQYGSSITNSMELNSYAWSMFEHSDNQAHLEDALSWSEKSLSGEYETNPNLLDTYANLLYKMGKKEDALTWEKKALEFAKNDDDLYSQIKLTIKKMEKGDKTW